MKKLITWACSCLHTNYKIRIVQIKVLVYILVSCLLVFCLAFVLSCPVPLSVCPYVSVCLSVHTSSCNRVSLSWNNRNRIFLNLGDWSVSGLSLLLGLVADVQLHWLLCSM